ncbi:hypothetical protein ABK040_010743 [Willaertia magna]
MNQQLLLESSSLLNNQQEQEQLERQSLSLSDNNNKKEEEDNNSLLNDSKQSIHLLSHQYSNLLINTISSTNTSTINNLNNNQLNNNQLNNLNNQTPNIEQEIDHLIKKCDYFGELIDNSSKFKNEIFYKILPQIYLLSKNSQHLFLEIDYFENLIKNLKIKILNLDNKLLEFENLKKKQLNKNNNATQFVTKKLFSLFGSGGKNVLFSDRNDTKEMMDHLHQRDILFNGNDYLLFKEDNTLQNFNLENSSLGNDQHVHLENVENTNNLENIENSIVKDTTK